MAELAISYSSRPDVTRATELGALAKVYAFVLSKNAVGATSTNGSAAPLKNGEEVDHVDRGTD